MRTGPPSEFRYTAWFRWNGSTLTADFDGEYAAELYAHTGDDSSDMDSFENVNLANDPSHKATADADVATFRCIVRMASPHRPPVFMVLEPAYDDVNVLDAPAMALAWRPLRG